LLLHVIDASDEHRHSHNAQVLEVLREIGADAVPQIEIYNKIDRLEDAEPRVDRDEDGRVSRVRVSATTGAGIELLRQALAEYFGPAEARPGPVVGHDIVATDPEIIPLHAASDSDQQPDLPTDRRKRCGT
jgi:GTP-binding protein HflX